MSPLPLPLKALRDLGLEQLGLYTLYKLGLRLGLFRAAPQKLTTDNWSLITDYGSLPSKESILKTIGADGKRALLNEANEIVGGQVRLFGGPPVALQLTPKASLVHWTDYETGKAKIDGDVKMIWEPARFGWATVLARAYHLSGDEKYAESFWTQLGTFLATNPPHRGPNWISAQEVALRLIALAFAGSLFRKADSSTEPRTRALAQAIAQHAERIPPTLMYARSQNNNHLLSEAAGLITAATVLPEHPSAKKWLALGCKWFNRALEKQIDDFGEYSQHSTNYHRVMLQLALWVRFLQKNPTSLYREETKSAKPNDEREGRLRLSHKTSRPSPLRGEIFSITARKNLQRASHWLASMLDSASGGVPNLGANDGAYILPLTICRFADFRPVMQSAARAFLQYDISPGAWDEMSLWLGNPPIGRSFDAEHYAADNLRGRESWAYLRTTRFTSRPGHADLLHLDLWWRGLNIARDAGTYTYNADYPWSNPLTSADFHNTVTVDERDQMTRVSRFLYLDWVNAYARTLIETDEKILSKVQAYHNAYRALGVKHERAVTVFSDDFWAVEDRLLTKKIRAREFRLHWLLPDWAFKVEERGTDALIHLQSPRGPIQMRVAANANPFDLQIVRAGAVVFGGGETESTRGWFSPTYSQKEAALSLSLTARADSNVTFQTEFTFPK